jgi:tRNA(Arg) A34 adenosine deaminase TadA
VGRGGADGDGDGLPGDGRAAWAALEAPWRAAFEQAWASYAAGSLGIGAVLTDPTGAVVATGRNRLLETEAPPGQVAGSTVAHAEVNALASVPVGRGRHLAIWSTLEPCLQCSGAIVMAAVPVVRFAGGDPLCDGLAGIAGCTPFVADRWPALHGPRPDRFGTLGALLPLARFVTLDRGDVVVTAYTARHPDLADLAGALTASGELDRLVARGATTADVVAALWDRLPVLA